MKRICPKCGAGYELTEVKTTVRDKDSLECNFCNETVGITCHPSGPLPG